MKRKQYSELSNKCWLENKYISECLSTVQIAKILECKPSSVSKALKRNGINIKSSKEASETRVRKGFKSKNLNDKDWLTKKYCDELLTTYEIANLAGTNQKSVCKAMKFHDIPTRSISESKILQQRINPTQSKYTELNNEQWLKEKYLEDKMSANEIADKIGCSSTIVLSKLKKYKIQIRNASEAGFLVERPSQYELLNNRDWLYDKYIKEGLGTKEITKLCGAKTPNSVRQSLIRHGIEVRNISEGLTHNRDGDSFVFVKDVIEGCLLGDASLSSYNRSSDISYPHFHKKNIYYEHVEYVASFLFSEDHCSRVIEEYSKDGTQYCFTVRSLSHKELKSYEKRWYPEWNNYKKVIPEDIEITERLLLHWFMDDGTSYLRKRHINNPNWTQKTKQVSIAFCTECFTKENQEMLAEKIRDKFNLDFKVRKYNWTRNDGTYVKGWRMFIPQSQADLFYRIIGPCPIRCFEYKWK